VTPASPQQNAPASLSASDVQKLAKLSHLQLSDERVEQLRSQLSVVLASMDVLRALPLDGLAPLTHVSEATNVLRADVPGPLLPEGTASSLPANKLSSREDLAPFVHVPKVLGGGGA
jgi:aspartyl-tRNA(Asn)/glutamyl-tRNA(Gln) amidotransferase subunit C